MIRAFRVFCGVIVLGVLTACSSQDSGPAASANKFRAYYGPTVTQVLVKKRERKMYLLHEAKILKEYRIGLGFDPVGHKVVEGDGKTPEGVYFIDRMNPSSRYHLSLGVSYPNPVDRQTAAAMGRSAGGDIMIHGRGPEGNAATKKDWTAGCIAVSDGEAEEIFAMVRPGVPIVILP